MRRADCLLWCWQSFGTSYSVRGLETDQKVGLN